MYDFVLLTTSLLLVFSGQALSNNADNYGSNVEDTNTEGADVEQADTRTIEQFVDCRPPGHVQFNTVCQLTLVKIGKQQTLDLQIARISFKHGDGESSSESGGPGNNNIQSGPKRDASVETEVAKNLLEIDVILDADIPAIRLRAEHVTCPMAGLYKCAYLQWQGDGGKCDKDDVSSEKNENNNSTILDAEEQEQRGSYDITVEVNPWQINMTSTVDAKDSTRQTLTCATRTTHKHIKWVWERLGQDQQWSALKGFASGQRPSTVNACWAHASAYVIKLDDEVRDVRCYVTAGGSSYEDIAAHLFVGPVTQPPDISPEVEIIKNEATKNETSFFQDMASNGLSLILVVGAGITALLLLMLLIQLRRQRRNLLPFRRGGSRTHRTPSPDVEHSPAPNEAVQTEPKEKEVPVVCRAAGDSVLAPAKTESRGEHRERDRNRDRDRDRGSNRGYDHQGGDDGQDDVPLVTMKARVENKPPEALTHSQSIKILESVISEIGFQAEMAAARLAVEEESPEVMKVKCLPENDLTRENDLTKKPQFRPVRMNQATMVRLQNLARLREEQENNDKFYKQREVIQKGILVSKAAEAPSNDMFYSLAAATDSKSEGKTDTDTEPSHHKSTISKKEKEKEMRESKSYLEEEDGEEEEEGDEEETGSDELTSGDARISRKDKRRKGTVQQSPTRTILKDESKTKARSKKGGSRSPSRKRGSSKTSRSPSTKRSVSRNRSHSRPRSESRVSDYFGSRTERSCSDIDKDSSHHRREKKHSPSRKGKRRSTSRSDGDGWHMCSRRRSGSKKRSADNSPTKSSSRTPSVSPKKANFKDRSKSGSRSGSRRSSAISQASTLPFTPSPNDSMRQTRRSLQTLTPQRGQRYVTFTSPNRIQSTGHMERRDLNSEFLSPPSRIRSTGGMVCKVSPKPKALPCGLPSHVIPPSKKNMVRAVGFGSGFYHSPPSQRREISSDRKRGRSPQKVDGFYGEGDTFDSSRQKYMTLLDDNAVENQVGSMVLTGDGSDARGRHPRSKRPTSLPRATAKSIAAAAAVKARVPSNERGDFLGPRNPSRDRKKSPQQSPALKRRREPVVSAADVMPQSPKEHRRNSPAMLALSAITGVAPPFGSSSDASLGSDITFNVSPLSDELTPVSTLATQDGNAESVVDDPTSFTSPYSSRLPVPEVKSSTNTTCTSFFSPIVSGSNYFTSCNTVTPVAAARVNSGPVKHASRSPSPACFRSTENQSAVFSAKAESPPFSKRRVSSILDTPSPTIRANAFQRTPSPGVRSNAFQRTPSPSIRSNAFERTPSPTVRANVFTRTPSPTIRGNASFSSGVRSPTANLKTAMAFADGSTITYPRHGGSYAGGITSPSPTAYKASFPTAGMASPLQPRSTGSFSKSTAPNYQLAASFPDRYAPKAAERVSLKDEAGMMGREDYDSGSGRGSHPPISKEKDELRTFELLERSIMGSLGRGTTEDDDVSSETNKGNDDEEEEVDFKSLISPPGQTSPIAYYRSAGKLGSLFEGSERPFSSSTQDTTTTLGTSASLAQAKDLLHYYRAVLRRSNEQAMAVSSEETANRPWPV